MDKILGMGNALIDILVTLQDDSLLEELKLPKGGMKLIDLSTRQLIQQRLDRMNTHQATGGAAANTMMGLANLNVPAGFIGKVGKDEFGCFFRKNLEDNKIEDRVLTGELPSGIASTFISSNGERTFGTYLGAASTLKVEDLSLEMFKGYAYLFIEGYLVQDHAMILRAIELAKEAGLQICMDMASYNVVNEEKDFLIQIVNKYVDILFANEEEAKAFTGKGPQEALEIMSKMCSIAVVKTGALGSSTRKGTEETHVPAVGVKKVIDTTGAGDYFAAGFMYGITGGYSLDKCAKIGSILAANVIQVIGTHLSANQWDEIKLNINEVLAE